MRRTLLHVTWLALLAVLPAAPAAAHRATRPRRPAIGSGVGPAHLRRAVRVVPRQRRRRRHRTESPRHELRHATTLELDRRHHRQRHPGHRHAVVPPRADRAQTRQTATYVLSLVAIASRVRCPGNAERGAAVYQSSGCGVVPRRRRTRRHPRSGADRHRRRRGAVYLRDAIVKPAASHPPGYLVVRAVPTQRRRGPRHSRQRRRVLDPHPRRAAATCTRCRSRSCRALDRELEATLMPSYESRLSPAQLDDLVAYLATLRGAK